MLELLPYVGVQSRNTTVCCLSNVLYLNSCLLFQLSLLFLLSLKFHAGLFKKEHHFIGTLDDARAAWGLGIKSRD